MTCARNLVGCDGHLYCTPDTWTARHCYVCIYPLESQSDTGAARDGCGLGCQDCLDYPDDQLAFKQKLFRTGKRFLRPKSGTTGRDAYGRLSDLITNVPLPVPRRVQYERAPCWTNDGDECFGTICDCDGSQGYNPSPSPEEGEVGTCHTPAGDVSAGDLLPGRLRDCKGYTSWDWRPPREENGTIDCRHIVNEPGPVPVQFSASDLCEPVNHRTMGCCANMMVLATAKIAGSDCLSGYQCFVDDTLLPGHPLDYTYYADGDVGTDRAQWDVMQFQNNAAFLHASVEQASDKLMVDCKNFALSALKTWSPFNTLANMVPGSSNLNLGLFRRDVDLTGQPVSSLPIVMPIRAGLRQANFSLPGYLRLYKATIEVKLIVIPVMVGNPLTSITEKWEPYVRVRMRMWTYIDVSSFGAAIVKDWKPLDDPNRTVSVEYNRPTIGGLPTVTPNIDEIIITNNNGLPFIPPRMIEWRGWRGAFSFPATTPIFQGTYNSSNQSNDLRKMIAGISTVSGHLTSSYLQIPGWSDQHEQNPTAPIQSYGGNVKIGFAT